MEYIWAKQGRKLDDYDIPRVGSRIGVGEDGVHCVMSVETKGYGFDSKGVTRLFEEHVFYRELPKARRKEAVALGLAYPKWRNNYKDNYNRFVQAYTFDPDAALRACSWGLGQIMGFNCRLAGYNTARDMVVAFAESEENQLQGMIEFIKVAGLDDELRALEKATDRKTMLIIAAHFARGYNGEKYYVHRYHIRLVDSLMKWRKIPDTPWTPEHAVAEEGEARVQNDKLQIPIQAEPKDMTKSSTVWAAAGSAATTVGTVLSSLKDLDPIVAVTLILVAVGIAVWIIKEHKKTSDIFGM